MMIKRKLHPYFKGNGGGSGIKRESKIHGVPQSKIDALKGVLDHQEGDSIGIKEVQDMYAKVGISLTYSQAQEVHSAVQHFTGSGYTIMRTAASKSAKGLSLTSSEQEALAQLKLCEEFCKVAPTFKSSTVSDIHRGISTGYTPASKAYYAKLLSLKPGDSYDLDNMPSSFSSKLSKAQSFAGGTGGIILHVKTSSLKNAPSIKGISYYPGEHEVLVADYNWKVGSISDQRETGDGYYHMYLEV